MVVSDLSLRCFGGGSADEVSLLAPSGSVVNGFGNFGQLGTGNNETLGDEVKAIARFLRKFARFAAGWSANFACRQTRLTWHATALHE